MLLTFKHDGTGYRSPGFPDDDASRVTVEVTGMAHTYDGQRSATAGNWLVWPVFAPEDDSAPLHCDTFAVAVYEAADLAAAILGGVELVAVAGVEVPEGWDAVARLSLSAQADPPFSDLAAVLGDTRAAVVYPARPYRDPNRQRGKVWYQIAEEGAPRPVCGYGGNRGPIYPTAEVATRAAMLDGYNAVRVTDREAIPTPAQ